MHIAIIAKAAPVSVIMQVLEACGKVEVLTGVNIADIEERFGRGWQSDAVFCELAEVEELRPLVIKLAQQIPQILLFSFTDQTTPEFEIQSKSLGFLAHIDNGVTVKELQLHLQYCQRLGRALNSNNQFRLEQMVAAVTAFHFTMETARVIEAALEFLLKIFFADSLALFLSSEEGDQLEMVGSFNSLPSPPLSMIGHEPGDSLLVRAANNDRSILINDRKELASDPRYQAGGFESVMFVPLHTRARLFGVAELARREGASPFNEQDMDCANQLATSLAAALANAITFTNAERLGQIDDLTQLYNSRYLYQALETEMKRSRRYKTPVSVIFLDLDGFKLVNDTNGHLCGSATLTEVASLMIALVRETDIVARYGGDEFVIVLPETPADRAVTIAERIRQQIENHTFRGGGDSEIYLTASFGVASYPENASSPAALIRCADKAMYVAKECNKNQVILAN